MCSTFKKNTEKKKKTPDKRKHGINSRSVESQFPAEGAVRRELSFWL